MPVGLAQTRQLRFSCCKFWSLIIGCPSTWVESFVLHDLK
ncbi:hypothetical protein SLEP1_g31540 [Rubroshorea leprosula]|uniref:Uncharacterized protein n=1 Tax=Rubroshorea leprosula TaxID=152421 RepID=A0AAV5KB47_9ROSI|nr:hypothetical protein SLEP1_g31540 [Rubroshorea leprosula]